MIETAKSWLERFPSTNGKAVTAIALAVMTNGSMCYVMLTRPELATEMAMISSGFVSALWAGAVYQFVRKRQTENVAAPGTVMAEDAGAVAVAHEEASAETPAATPPVARAPRSAPAAVSVHPPRSVPPFRSAEPSAEIHVDGEGD